MGKNNPQISDWADTLKILDANYIGAVSIFNILGEAMKTRGSGVMVGISSVAGERGRKSNYLYGSAKAGFSAYLSGLRNALYAHGVQVITVKPGFIYTSMTEGLSLPPMLTAKATEVADSVYGAIEKRKDIIYIKWFWKWIMWIIRNIPEKIFKKLSL
jgi:short-subunit dehydrogenase